MTLQESAASRVNPLRPAMASLIGTAIEWYDYFVYGLAAAVVFGPLFFPEFSPTAGTLAAFATYSVGFLARPVGGVVMGHFGDRVGRKTMLVTSLLVMGTATMCIGLLPTYSTIGVWAPVLLVVLRFVQGLAVGGEWGGAVLMAVEHAPQSRKAFYGSFPQMGVPAGLILANLVLLGVSNAVGDAAFLAWGWRLPFLASAVLVIVGLFLRLSVEESPAFLQMTEQEQRRLPIIDVVRDHWRKVLLISGAFIGINAVAYVFMTFLLTYTTQVLKMERSTVLTISLAAAGVWLLVTPWASILSDRHGRRRVLLSGSIALSVFALVLLPAADTTRLPLLIGAVLGLAVTMGAVYGPMAALFSSQFPTPIRYSGTSLGYQIGSLLGGGIAPTVATALLSGYGSSTPITVYLVGTTVISLGCVAALVRSQPDAAGVSTSDAHRRTGATG
ncbi:metabolite-proton symporter [Actinocorallia herbida]|uniref:Putative proline/betaine transporter n=1 Tax=Actinocorallia herbida TaxID=58109 RepID=A0A3N1D2V0_9ACTN|nr:MFS transporter [Actinocorallia herbida]ROO87849.1 metabolite-proton symporter [Actinocorallia herbida]